MRLLIFFRLLFCTVTFTAQFSVFPSGWSAFVRSAENTQLTDTFRCQDFEGLAADNWPYTLSGGAGVFDASQAGVAGQWGVRSLKIPPGGGVQMAPFPLIGYNDVVISAYFAASGVKKGENLHVRFTNQNSGDKETALVPVVSASPVSFGYGVAYVYGNEASQSVGNPIRIKGNPSRVAFRALNPEAGEGSGFYGIDRLTAYGAIARYTLFTGQAGWNDTLHWSHFPAARHRSALIRGDVTVSARAGCRDLEVGAGSLRISAGAVLSVADKLILYDFPDERAAFYNAGTLAPPGRVTVRKAFPEKGKWYFVSFPFDVYADGIPGFTLKGGEPNAGGDYFYVQYYDSERRALSGLDRSNWIIRASVPPGEPVFEKNKGYLVALDESASSTVVDFSSAAGAVSAGFGKSGSVDAACYLHDDDPRSPHSGWFLCGNPLPAPLPVKMLAGVAGLGRYLYFYDGNTYQVYETGGDGVIPAYGAFFLKVTRNCSIRIDCAAANESTGLPAQAAPEIVVVELSDGVRADRTAFRCLPGASGGAAVAGAEPAYKWRSPDPHMPQLASGALDESTALAVRPSVPGEGAIPLGLYLGRSGRHTLSLAGLPEKDGVTVKLIDCLRSDTVSMKPGETYAFDGAAGFCNDRFVLRIDPAGADSGLSPELLPEPVCFMEGNRLHAKGLPQSGYANLLDADGTVCQRIALPAGDSAAFVTLPPGSYTVFVRAGRFERSIPVSIGR